MNNPTISRRELLRAVFRSRFAQVVYAIALLGVCVSIALAFWHARDLLSGILFFLIVIFGLHLSWELLPVSAATRARREQSRHLANRFPSYRFRVALWVGLGLAASPLFRSFTEGNFELNDFFVSGVFVCIGAISYMVWHFKDQNEAKQNEQDACTQPSVAKAPSGE